MSPSVIEETSASEWDYVAEGGANIVVAYNGSSKVYRHKALRLPKFTSTTHSTDTNHKFTQLVISPLLGDEFLPTMEKVSIPSKFLKEIYQHIKDKRPDYRKEEKEDDIDQSLEVFLVENLVGNAWDEDALAIEIKPKWGFIPNLTYLSEDSKDVKSRFCRFCMHQIHKSRKGQAGDDKRFYCPLDLYANDPVRVKIAGEGLWDDWVTSNGKHNNLRLFFNGLRITPETVFTYEPLIDFLQLPHNASKEIVRDAFSTHLSKFLVKSPVLARLKYLQESLDVIDIEGISSLYLSQTDTPLSESYISSPTLEEWESFVEVFTHPEWIPQVKAGHISLRNLTLAYILSATFKDCSLFVRLEKPKDGTTIVPKFRVIDLDQKEINRIKKYEKLDEEIVRDFKAWLYEGGKKENCHY